MSEVEDEENLEQAAPEEEAREYLTFRLEGEEYAVPIEKVKEIRAWEAVTRVPHSERWECGLINIRGAIVPIIDMRLRLSLPAKAYTKHTVVVLFSFMGPQGKEKTVGVVVDELSDVVRFQDTHIQQPPQLSRRRSMRFAAGVVEHDSRMIVLLDINAAIAQDESRAA